MQWNALSNRYKEALIRLFFPTTCGLCQCLLELQEKGICQACHERLTQLEYPIQERYQASKTVSLDRVWALYPYQSWVKDLLTSVKFQRKQWLLKVFSKQLCETASIMASETTYQGIIPIPMDRKRQVEREFNQAESLALVTSKTLKIPVRLWLEKPKATPAQSHMDQAYRAINLFRAFRVKEKNGIKDQKFLLLDDIFTTGATAEEAARTLKEHGAKRVDLLVIARTPKNQSSKEVQKA